MHYQLPDESAAVSDFGRSVAPSTVSASKCLVLSVSATLFDVRSSEDGFEDRSSSLGVLTPFSAGVCLTCCSNVPYGLPFIREELSTSVTFGTLGQAHDCRSPTSQTTFRHIFSVRDPGL